MDISEFQNFLREKIREYGLSLRKLSEISGISLPHLEQLSAGRFEDLPPAPYLQGYLKKLGGVLGFDGDEWWDKLQKEGVLKTAGAEDLLPKNRFARRPIGKAAWLAAAVLVIGMYLVFRSPQIFGRPVLTITAPEEGVASVTDASFVLEGTLAGGDSLSVNGESVPLGRGGAWSATVLLEPGPNPVEIVGRKFLGGETRIVRQIIYAPAADAEEDLNFSPPAVQ